MPGVAIATAARLESRYGLPQFAPERLRKIGEYLQKAGLDLPDPDQVVLIADRLPPGMLESPLAGLEIVGVALGDDLERSSPSLYPTVVGLGAELLQETEEGEIVIVDGDRGRVYVSPDAQTLARYQGPARRSRRFFLEPTHLPARRASDGRMVAVLATARDADEVSAALAAGADGICISDTNSIFAPHKFLTASEQLGLLQSIMETLGGKTLLIQVPLERLALSALARLAAFGQVGLALTEIGDIWDVREEFEGLETELQEMDIDFGRVDLEAVVNAPSDLLPEQMDFVDGMIVTDEMSLGDAPTESVPLTLIPSNDHWQIHLSSWLDYGVARFIVPPEEVQRVKEAVRQS